MITDWKIHRHKYPGWKSPLERLTRFAAESVGEPASRVLREFNQSFDGCMIGDVCLHGKMKFNAANRSAFFEVSSEAFPDEFTGIVVVSSK